MTDAGWDHVKEVFEKVLHAPEPERRELLSDEDETTRREVESLLEAHSAVPDMLDRPAYASFTDFAEGRFDGWSPGEEVGEYVLIERIAAGGMGTVWRARPVDEPDESVAIKFIRPGIDTAMMVRRFATERRSLASLDHPNIARLLDGGLTRDGKPFLVMEYIEGISIDRYCDQKRLGISERLKLFETVCAAVQHAHQSLVVHRDLKPENILVSHDGVPKLLDFGIAKILDSETGEATLTLTDARPLTPQYASPEQIRGDRITTATDVYSLGVVLFELLTGHRPYHIETTTRQAAVRAITELEPGRPSQMVLRPRLGRAKGKKTEILATPEQIAERRSSRPDSLSRRLRGDLDNIVLKAMRKEPDRRYASANQIVEEIDRHRRGMPIQAREDTWRYRVGKFVRRNRASVAAGAIVTLSLFGGAVGITWQAKVAEREAKFAKGEAESLHRVVDFLIDLFDSASPLEGDGRGPTAYDLLQGGVDKIPSSLEDQPEVRSALLLAMGRAFHKLKELERSEGLLEECLAIREVIYPDGHPERAEIQNSLGALRRDQARYDEAELLLRSALGIWSERWGADHLDAAHAANNLGLLLQATGAYEEAEELQRQVLRARRAKLGEDHSDVQEARNNLAGTLVHLYRFGEAQLLLEEALAVSRRIHPEAHPATATQINNLGLVLHERGELHKARRHYHEALAMRRSILAAGHPDIASSLNNLGGVDLQQDRLGDALAKFREAAELSASRLGPTHPQSALYRMNEARALSGLGQQEDAELLLAALVAEQSQLLPETHPLLAAIVGLHGDVLQELGQWAAATARYEQLLRLRMASFPDDHPAVLEASSALAKCRAAGEAAGERDASDSVSSGSE